MTMKNRLLAGLAAAAIVAAPFSLAPILPAKAAWVVACAPDVAGGVQGPKQIVVPGSTVASAYNLNSNGCAAVGTSDRGYLASQGFVFNGGLGSAQVTFSATPATVTLPPGAAILAIAAQETSGTAITGGIKIGTTSGGGNVVTGQALGSRGTIFLTGSTVLIPTFSTTASQVLFMDATGNSNLFNSQVTVTVLYGYY